MNWFSAAVAALPVVTLASFQGDGTTYSLGNLSGGNSNFMSNPQAAKTKYAAINAAQWESTMSCGRCAQVTCIDELCADAPQASEVVYIVDQCPGCLDGDLDLSPEVFESITGLEPVRVKIEWSFVDCPVAGNIKYCLKTGSNPFWTAIQPTNFVSGVKSLTINDKSVDMVDSAFYFLLDGNSQDATDLSKVKISMVSVDGDEVTDTVSFPPDSCVEGASQFGDGNSATLETPAAATAAPSTSAPTTPTPTASMTLSPTPIPSAAASESSAASPKQTPAPTTSVAVPALATPAPSQTAKNTSASPPVRDSSSSSVAHDAEDNEKSTGASGSSGSSSSGASAGSGGESSGDGIGSVAGTTSSSIAEAGVVPSFGQSPTPTSSPGDATTVSTRTGDAGLNATALVVSFVVLLVIAFGIVMVLIIAVRKKKTCPEKTDDRMSVHGQAADARGVYSAASTPSNRHRLA